jgi:hypothetical protein
MCPKIFILRVVPKEVHLQQVLKMPSMRFNARLDTAHHGSPHQFKVADNVTGIQNAMVKFSLIVNRSCIHKGVYVSPQEKIQRIQIWRAWRPCSRPPLPIFCWWQVLLRTSPTARLKCAGAPSCMYHICALTANGTSSSSFGRSSETKSR